MKEKNDIPVYTESAKELKDEINARIAEVMRENFADPMSGQLEISPVIIHSIKYNQVALCNDKEYRALYSEGRLLSSSTKTDLPIRQIPDKDMVILRKVFGNIGKSFYCGNGHQEAVAANANVHHFTVGENVVFQIDDPSDKNKRKVVEGAIEKLGTAYNISHLFGAPAITIDGEKYFIDKIREGSLTVPSLQSYGNEAYKFENLTKKLSDLPIKDFDIKVGNDQLHDLETAIKDDHENASFVSIDTVCIRNRQLESLNATVGGYRYHNGDPEDIEDFEESFSIKIANLNDKEQKSIINLVARKMPFVCDWNKQKAIEITNQEKADRVLATLLKGVNPSQYIDKNKISMSDRTPLTSLGMSDDKPLHTHVWAEALRQQNDKEWKNIVELLKEDTVLWEEVKAKYPHLSSDNEIADRVLADLLKGVNPSQYIDKAKKQNNDVSNQMEDTVNRQPETQKAQEAEEFEDVDNERVLSDADIASPKHQIREAIVERILNPSSDATFTKEQQDTIISYLKDYPTVDGKLQALSPLWQDAEQDSRVKGEPKEWFEPVKEELNDLASGIRREPSEGLKLK